MTVRGWKLLLVSVLCVAASGCEAEDWLRARGAHAFREVDVAEARRLLAEEGGVLIQVDEPAAGAIGAAWVLSPDAPLPDALREPYGAVLVLASEAAAARRLAARLARAGAVHVAVVRGGVDAWSATPPMARTLAGPLTD